MNERVKWISAGLIVIKPCTNPVEILLVKYRLPGKTDRYIIEPPKGIVENAEDVLQTAIRETIEETGLAKSDIEIVHTIKPLVYRYRSWLDSYDNIGIKELHLYVAFCKKCIVKSRTDEADSVFFAPIDLAIQLITKKHIVDWLMHNKDMLQEVSYKACEKLKHTPNLEKENSQ